MEMTSASPGDCRILRSSALDTMYSKTNSIKDVRAAEGTYRLFHDGRFLCRLVVTFLLVVKYKLLFEFIRALKAIIQTANKKNI